MIYKDFFNWIFPPKCLICSCEIIENSIFCPDCFSKVTIIDYPFCKICGKMLETSFDDEMICDTCLKYPRAFDKARSLFQYDDVSKKIIMKIKKQSDFAVAKSCSKMIISKYRDLFATADFITPVPSHWTRVLKRGFNPADIIAFSLSKISGIPVRKFLKRIKQTQYQKNKSILERFENVEGAFDCKSDLAGANIILVDDVLTTGATLNECSKVLKLHGCCQVYCITVGSTPNLSFIQTNFL